MPNWAKGTLKLKGRKENIASALKEMLLNDSVTLEEQWNGNVLVFNSEPELSYFYINGTRRAFIGNDQIEVRLDDNFCVIELDNFKQAWAAIPENYQEISKKHDVDIKIFTFEMGMEFTQEIEIRKGKIIQDICNEYDDYRWDVPFSNLGG